MPSHSSRQITSHTHESDGYLTPRRSYSTINWVFFCNIICVLVVLESKVVDTISDHTLPLSERYTALPYDMPVGPDWDWPYNVTHTGLVTSHLIVSAVHIWVNRNPNTVMQHTPIFAKSHKMNLLHECEMPHKSYCHSTDAHSWFYSEGLGRRRRSIYHGGTCRGGVWQEWFLCNCALRSRILSVM